MVRASETLGHGRSDPGIHRPFAQRWQRAHGDRTPHVRLQAEVEVASPRVLDPERPRFGGGDWEVGNHLGR